MAPNAAIILEQHNLEWQIFDRLALSLAAPFRQLAKVEAQALRRYESRALTWANSVIAISEADAEQFRKMSGVEAVVVPPHTEPNPCRFEFAHNLSLGYIGHLAWQPNVYGLDWFCKDVWPKVRELIPDSRLAIAGPGLRKGPSGTLEVPAAWQLPGITTVGFLDDLNDLYRVTSAMIAPVVGGSGVRMKILETMSAGMPTITTSDGAAGLDVVNGRELLIADEADEFAECVARVLRDADLREQLRRAGYAYLTSHHSESKARSSLERALAIKSNSGTAHSNTASNSAFITVGEPKKTLIEIAEGRTPGAEYYVLSNGHFSRVMAMVDQGLDPSSLSTCMRFALRAYFDTWDIENIYLGEEFPGIHYLAVHAVFRRPKRIAMLIHNVASLKRRLPLATLRLGRLLDHVLCLSEESRHELEAIYSIPPSRITVIGSRVDTAFFFAHSIDSCSTTGLLCWRYQPRLRNSDQSNRAARHSRKNSSRYRVAIFRG